jgi:hypothetical protein
MTSRAVTQNPPREIMEAGAMKALISLILLIGVTAAGCAAGYNSVSKAEGDRQLQEIYRDNPDTLRIWQEERGR